MPPESSFPFTYDRVRDERAESVYWRKYALSISEVHRRGCDLQGKRKAGENPQVYVGAQTVVVEKVRAIKSGRGHSFKVIHAPRDDDIAHTHIAIARASGPVKNINKNDRVELTSLLVDCLGGDIDRHDCP